MASNNTTKTVTLAVKGDTTGIEAAIKPLTASVSKLLTAFSSLQSLDFTKLQSSLDGISNTLGDFANKLSNLKLDKVKEAGTGISNVSKAKDIQGIDGKKLKDGFDSIYDSLNDFTSKISTIKQSVIDTVKSFGSAVSTVTKAATSLDGTDTKVIKDKFEDVTDGAYSFAKKFSRIKLEGGERAAKMVDNLTESVANLKHIPGKRISDIFTRSGDGVKYILDQIKGYDSKEISKTGNTVKNIEEGLFNLSFLEDKDFQKITKGVSDFLNGINDTVNNVDTASMSKMGVMFARFGKAGTQLNNLTEEQFNKVRDRASKMSQDELLKMEEKMWKSRQVNQDIHRQNQRDEAGFLEDLIHLDFHSLKVGLFGKPGADLQPGQQGPVQQGRKGGDLMLDLKSGLSKGIKGMLIGSILNVIKGIFTKIKDGLKFLFTKPLKMIRDFGKKALKFLTGTVKQAKTFQALYDLAVKPFVLLFTLLFAPILAALAPVLAEVIQHVADRWPDIQAAGERIAEVVKKIFDEDQWFTLDKIIDTIIDTIMWLSEVAEEVFSQEGNIVDKLVTFMVIVFQNFTDAILNWLYTTPGQDMIKTIAMGLGIVIFNMLKLMVSVLPAMIEGVFYIFAGVMVSMFYQLFSWIIDAVSAFVYAFKGVINAVGNLMGLGNVGDTVADMLTTFQNKSDLVRTLQETGEAKINDSYNTYITNNTTSSGIQGYGTGLGSSTGTYKNSTV